LSPRRDPDLEQRIRNLGRQGLPATEIGRIVGRDQAVVRSVLNPQAAAARAQSNAAWKKRHRDQARQVQYRYRKRSAQPLLTAVPDTAELYVIGSTVRGIVKIGQSVNPEYRLSQLQTGSPVPLSIVWRMPDGAAMEPALHAYFSDRQAHGEHFDFGDDDPLELIQEAVETIQAVAQTVAADSRLAKALAAYLHAGGIPDLDEDTDGQPADSDNLAEPPWMTELPVVQDALF
jgi:hypothetical protein